MYLPKKHISRRTLLRGMGATVALPFLDAMVPARTLLANTVAAGKTPRGSAYPGPSCIRGGSPSPTP